ncbi:ABC transporter ATP-binding protein [Paenibacillus lycopersici]|uniref:ABC transporter ATP-binding protein n=1 Tax=Paenibacillus lycopersici TaxID=2704462 RepID=A0A6C0FWA4_9BACL|nr:ABC transporter ATP-binding protein [Paenibacillus lycopersici]QHT59564.1 ABC transporter ATP-binding protein [Paenibacillus lycopersici]
MGQAILNVTGLCKHYKGVKAVDGVDMQLNQGDIYGFLGQNGAGKTTTIRMMMGLIQPTSGSVKLFGEEVGKGGSAVLRKVGSVIEYPGFYPNLTAIENLDLHRRLMGVKNKRSMEEALHTTGLWEARNRKAANFSLGMKQRLGIARAILHGPELLILDEPTNGLDPMGIKEIRLLIQELAQKRNITILVSSHILSEVEQLATKVGIIHRGVMLEESTMQALKHKNRQYIGLQVDDFDRSQRLLKGELGIRDCRMEDDGWLRVYDEGQQPGEMNRLLVREGIEVNSLVAMKDSLEDYFVRLVEGGSQPMRAESHAEDIARAGKLGGVARG